MAEVLVNLSLFDLFLVLLFLIFYAVPFVHFHASRTPASPFGRMARIDVLGVLYVALLLVGLVLFFTNPYLGPVLGDLNMGWQLLQLLAGCMLMLVLIQLPVLAMMDRARAQRRT